jgi:AraC-like DNA-binding protein
MPSSAVRTFTDPDDYAAAQRGVKSELTLIGRGHFTAKLIGIALHRLGLQRSSDNLPRTAHSVNWKGLAIITFRTHPGPSLVRSGVEMEPTNISRHGEDQAYYQRSSGSASFGALSVAVEDVAAIGEAMGGADLTPPRDAMLVTPPPSAMAKLQRLHAAAGQLAEDAPAVIAHPEAARGLEQALIEAMVSCLVDGDVREDSVAQRHHELIMRRFRRVVEEHPEKPLYVPEICKAIRVSQRTLLACCQEHLGMAPKHYLLLRRMHLARRALREAGPDAPRVTDVATRYGFWQLGRFAVEYQSLFGESPSATLRSIRAAAALSAKIA